MRNLIVTVLMLVALPAQAHDCELPPAQYDHMPGVPVTIDTVLWYHLAKACGYQDPPPQIPALYAGGGARLFDLNRPNSCRWREPQGLWHVVLPTGGGWREAEVDRCKRFEFGSINGWKHRDPTE